MTLITLQEDYRQLAENLSSQVAAGSKWGCAEKETKMTHYPLAWFALNFSLSSLPSDEEARKSKTIREIRRKFTENLFVFVRVVSWIVFPPSQTLK